MRVLIAVGVLFSLNVAIAQSSANASENERILTRLENDWAHALVGAIPLHLTV